MGLVNIIRGEYKLGCCDKAADKWQAKGLEIRTIKSNIVNLYGSNSVLNIEDIVSGHMDNFCRDCKKTTRWYIKDEKITHGLLFWYERIGKDWTKDIKRSKMLNKKGGQN